MGFVSDTQHAEVIVHFADDPPKLYQLRQWLAVFERLDAAHPVVIVTRDPRTHAELARETPLPMVLLPEFAALRDWYERSPAKVAIYVNNSLYNFQSLISRRMLHIHVNHGESDKVCMVSNNVKAYDRVFVAGDAAVLRYRTGLLELDDHRLVRVGRPQLDLRPAPVLPASDRRTILYAPTWEGEDESNNYTSLDRYGPDIVAAALAVPHTRVVYKPHPRVETTRDRGVGAAHSRIVRMLDKAARRDPAAGHRAASGDILAVFPGCDLMITDVSSVGLDFLYLHTDKPLFVTDRRGDRVQLAEDAPISRCADVVDAGTIAGLDRLLDARLARDEHRPAREALRRHYFGDLAPGESTERFLAAVTDTIRTRDRLLGQVEVAV